MRPYAKYDSAPDGSILMTFSDGHPGSYKNNLYYMRYKSGRFYKADGTIIGTTRDLPFRLGQLDIVQRYSAAKGRPWPMDIAFSSDGVPVIVYSSRVGDDDDFRYARWNGERWATRLISEAGGSLFGYRNGGITFNHADPDWVVLTRLIDGAHEIELRHTPDEGRTWEAYQLTTGSQDPQLPPGVPARDHRSGEARGGLRVGRGVELPQLPHGGEHADRPPTAPPAPRRPGADADPDPPHGDAGPVTGGRARRQPAIGAPVSSTDLRSLSTQAQPPPAPWSSFSPASSA